MEIVYTSSLNRFETSIKLARSTLKVHFISCARMIASISTVVENCQGKLSQSWCNPSKQVSKRERMNWPLLVPLSVSLSNLKQTPSLSRRSNTISLTVANLDFCKFPLHVTSLHLSCPLAQPSTNSIQPWCILAFLISLINPHLISLHWFFAQVWVIKLRFVHPTDVRAMENIHVLRTYSIK